MPYNSTTKTTIFNTVDPKIRISLPTKGQKRNFLDFAFEPVLPDIRQPKLSILYLLQNYQPSVTLATMKRKYQTTNTI